MPYVSSLYRLTLYQCLNQCLEAKPPANGDGMYRDKILRGDTCAAVEHKMDSKYDEM